MQTTFNSCKYTCSAADPTPLSTDQVKSLESKGTYDISCTIAKIVSEQFGKKDPVKFKLSLKHKEITLITNRPDGVEEEIKLVKDGTDWKQGTSALPHSEKISKRVEKALKKIREASKDTSSAKGPSGAISPKPELPVSEIPKAERIETLEKEIAGLKASIEKLSEGLKTSKASDKETLETLRKEKEDFQKRLADLEPKAKDLKEEISTLKEKLQSAGEALNAETKQKAQLKEKNAKSEKQLQKLKQNLEKLVLKNEAEEQILEQRILELEAEKQALSAEKDKFNVNHRALLEQKTQEISDLICQIAQAKEQETQHIRQIFEKDAELKRLTAVLAQNTAQAKQMNSTDQEKIQRLENELETLRSASTRTKADKDELSRQLKTAQEMLERAQAANTASLQQAEIKVNGLSEKLAVLQKENSEMQSRYAAELVSAQSNLEAAKAETQAAKTELSKVHSEKNHFERLYNEALAKLKQFEESLAQTLAKSKALLGKEELEAGRRIADAYAKATAALEGK